MNFFNTKDLLSLKKFKTFKDIPQNQLDTNRIYNVANYIYIYKDNNFFPLFGLSKTNDVNNWDFNGLLSIDQRVLIKSILNAEDNSLKKLLRLENLKKEDITDDRKKEILDFLNIKKTNFKFEKFEINKDDFNSDTNSVTINHNYNLNNEDYLYPIIFDDNDMNIIGSVEGIDENNCDLVFDSKLEPFNGYVYLFGVLDLQTFEDLRIDICNKIGEIVYIFGDKDFVLNNSDYRDLLICDGSLVDIYKYERLHNAIQDNYTDVFNDLESNGNELFFDLMPDYARINDSPEANQFYEQQGGYRVASNSQQSSSTCAQRAFDKTKIYWESASKSANSETRIWIYHPKKTFRLAKHQCTAWSSSPTSYNFKQLIIHPIYLRDLEEGDPWKQNGDDIRSRLNSSADKYDPIVSHGASNFATANGIYTFNIPNFNNYEKCNGFRFHFVHNSSYLLMSQWILYDFDFETLNKSPERYLKNNLYFRLPNIAVKQNTIPCIYFR